MSRAAQRIWGVCPIDRGRLTALSAAMIRFIGRVPFSLVIRRLIAASIAVLAACASTHAQSSSGAPIHLADTADFRVDLTPHVEYFVDDTQQMQAAEVAANGVFLPLNRRFIDFGRVAGRVWFRFSIVNPTPNDGEWRLDIRLLTADDLQVLSAARGQAPVLRLKQSASDEFDTRPIPTRYLSVDLHVRSGETLDVLVAHRTGFTQWIPMAITTPDAYYRSQATADAMNLAVYGAILAILVFSAMMLPVLGWRLSLAVSVNMLVSALFLAHAEGYTFSNLWPNLPWLNSILWVALVLLVPAAGASTVREFFRTYEHFPQLDRLLLGAGAFAAALAIVSPFVKAPLAFGFSATVLGVGVAALAVLTSVRALRRGLPGAAPFLVSTVLASITILYTMAIYLAPGSASFETALDIVHVQTLLVSICLLVAIVVRLADIQRERDRALAAELAAANEHLNLNRELQQSQRNYERARRVADARRARLSHVGHDLQQPLSSLRMALDRLTESDEKTALHVHTVVDYLESLAREQIEQGRMDGHRVAEVSAREVFPVRAVLDNVREMFASEAAVKGLDFRYRVGADSVSTNPIALMRLINNLVANAIRHTDSGGILLAARPRTGSVQVEVWDTGCGMDAEALTRMLLPHAKGERSTGEGLGLAIASEIAQELGVQLTLASSPGKGTRATVRVQNT